jgi:hypothetical protein
MSATKTRGRPTKITSELIKKIVRLIKADNYFDVACRACGITRQTGYNWLERGKVEAQRIESGGTPVDEPLYVEFFYSVDQAEAQAECEDIRYIRSGYQDWQARAWIRERKCFERWGKKESHEITGKDGKPIETVTRVVDVFTE